MLSSLTTTTPVASAASTPASATGFLFSSPSPAQHPAHSPLGTPSFSSSTSSSYSSSLDSANTTASLRPTATGQPPAAAASPNIAMSRSSSVLLSTGPSSASALARVPRSISTSSGGVGCAIGMAPTAMVDDLLMGLPNEVLIVVLSHIDAKSLLESRTTSRVWLQLTQEPLLWKLKCERLGLDPKKKPSHKSWEWFCLAHTITLRKPPPASVPLAIGKCTLPTGDVYWGDWQHGKPDGFGYSSGKKCDCTGEWRDGQLNGRGIKMWKEGDRYEGEFVNGKKTRGMKIYLNGDCYDGEWKEEVRQGRGTYIWIIGDRYEGEWEMGNLHGTGTYYWADSRVYTGEWRRHNQEGRGIFRWPDGATYDGYWLKGKRHGFGVMTWTDGSRWVGEWDSDARRPETGRARHADDNAASNGPSSSSSGAGGGSVATASRSGGSDDSVDRPRQWDNFFNMSFSDQRAFVQDFMNAHNKAAAFVRRIAQRGLGAIVPAVPSY